MSQLQIANLLAKETLRPILHRTLWSLKCAFVGQRPQVGPDGLVSSIPVQHRSRRTAMVKQFSVTEYKGDWEWHVFLWDLQANWRRNQLCHQCVATRRPQHGICFINFGHNFTRRSAVDCLIRAMPEVPCPLVLVPGWHPGAMRFCAMHVCNLGIYQTLVAEGILWIATHNGFGAGELEDQLHAGYRAFKAWMSETGVYCSGRVFNAKRLHLSDIDYPWLGYKAYNCRVALAWVAATLCSPEMQTTVRGHLGANDVVLHDTITSCVFPG